LPAHKYILALILLAYLAFFDPPYLPLTRQFCVQTFDLMAACILYTHISLETNRQMRL